MNPVHVSIGLAERWPRFSRFATRCSFWIRYPSAVFGVFRGISFAYCDAAAAVTHALNPAVYCVLCCLLTRALVPQAALLYTSTSGQRRVRCHTLGLPVTGLLPNIFRSTGENGDSHCLWGVRVDAVLGVGVFCPSKSKFVSFPDTCRVLIGTRGAPAL